MKNQLDTDRRIRLNWDESLEHYQAIYEIEKKHNPLIKSAPTEKKAKRATIARDNDVFDYLKERDLVYHLGGFYVRELFHRIKRARAKLDAQYK